MTKHVQTAVPLNTSIAEVSVGSQQDLDSSYGSNAINEGRFMQAAASVAERKRRSTNESDNENVEKKRRKSQWTAAEDEALLGAMAQERHNSGMAEDDEFEDEDWDAVAENVPGKSAVECFKRYTKMHASKKISRSTSHSSSLGTQSHDGEEDMDGDTSHKGGAASKIPPAIDGAGDWTEDEILLLKRLVETYKDTAPRWNEISANFVGHSPIECLTKWQTLTNPPVIKGKGSWTAEEDAILREKRQMYGRKWAKIAAHLPGRQGKQCRERFVNHLDPQLKKGEWTDDEEAILIAMHEQYGNRWANISKNLPGRSDNDVKNHWYSTIQRKFAQHGREKLTEAALQQVQLMQSLGTMPTQQPNAAMHAYSAPPPSYGQNGSPQNGPQPHQPPPPYPMYGYPYHPPPPGQGMGSNGGSNQSQGESVSMPPPSHPHHAPPPHWHYPPAPHAGHHPHPSMLPPPHPYYHQHYGNNNNSRPPSFMPQGTGRAADDSKKKDDKSDYSHIGSPWRQDRIGNSHDEV
uniref:Uncharacterized protein n=1 Tax=Amphora coffeiformis TaxID=265554 RepID=A0A7S3P8G1_9STRA